MLLQVGDGQGVLEHGWSSASCQWAHFEVWPMPGFRLLVGVERAVEVGERGLGVVEVADVVLGRVLGAAGVEQLPHGVLEREAVVALLHHVVLVEDVAEEVAVVELLRDLRVDLRRQPLEPVAVVAAERDVEGDDVLDLARRARRGSARRRRRRRSGGGRRPCPPRACIRRRRRSPRGRASPR